MCEVEVFVKKYEALLFTMADIDVAIEATTRSQAGSLQLWSALYMVSE